MYVAPSGIPVALSYDGEGMEIHHAQLLNVNASYLCYMFLDRAPARCKVNIDAFSAQCSILYCIK